MKISCLPYLHIRHLWILYAISTVRCLCIISGHIDSKITASLLAESVSMIWFDWKEMGVDINVLAAAAAKSHNMDLSPDLFV